MATALLHNFRLMFQESPTRPRYAKRRKMGNSASSTPQHSQRTHHPRSQPVQVDLLSLVCNQQLQSKPKFRELMEALTQSSGDINAVDSDGMTPLHFAVLYGEKLCAMALIALGANINALNVFNQTPLDIAVQNKEAEHFIPFLVSVGCKCSDAARIFKRAMKRFSPSPTSSAESSPECKRTTSAPTLPVTENLQGACASVAKNTRRQSVRVEYSACRGSYVFSQELEEEIKRRFEESMSLKPDEAFALALQQQELSRYRAESRASMDSRIPSPVEFLVEGGSRILSLDGGGIKGLVQIEVLSELERQTGRKITELFDWIIGTSTGGILALCLVYCKMDLNRLRRLYFRLKEEIFSNSRMGYAYDANMLEDILKEEMGTELRMSDVQHPKVLISAVDKRTTRLQLHFFNNCFADEFSTQYIWQVARYTSAAPMYFTECDNYVDGGVLANNPCDNGLTRIQKFYREQGQRFPIACVVSVGSGIYPAEELGSVDAHEALSSGRQFFRMGDTLRRAQNLMRLLGAALVESEAVAEKVKGWCVEQGVPFFRLSPQLEQRVEPGETDNLRLLEMLVRTKISLHGDLSPLLDRLVPLLRDLAEEEEEED